MQRIRLAVGMTMFIDGLLYLAIFPLLPIFSEQFDLSKLEAAVILSGYQVAFVATAIPAGWLAGRFGPRTVVIAGLICFVLASGLFAVAPTFGLLVAARALQGGSPRTPSANDAHVSWVCSQASPPPAPWPDR